MKKILLKIRKNKIKKILFKKNIDNSCSIFNLLNENLLNSLILNLKKEILII